MSSTDTSYSLLGPVRMSSLVLLLWVYQGDGGVGKSGVETEIHSNTEKWYTLTQDTDCMKLFFPFGVDDNHTTRKGPEGRHLYSWN